MSTERETLLDVEGMTCGSCIRHVNAALRSVDGVVDVEVDLPKGEVRVWHGAAPGTDLLVSAVRNAGYDAVLRGGQ
jgi:copper chaperone